jgi:hypothetical protein
MDTNRNANGHEEKPLTADESAAAPLWRDRQQIYADSGGDGKRNW